MVVGFFRLVGCKEDEDKIPRAVAISIDGAMEVELMTFNLRYENKDDRGVRAWRERVVEIVRMVRHEEVDILGVQEGLHGQVADLRASLPDFLFEGVGRSDGNRGGEYAGIFYKHDRFELDQNNRGTMWLSDTPERAGSLSWGNKIPRIATWVRLLDRSSGQALWVINTHLDHQNQPSREKGVQLIARKLVAMNSTHEPVVWMGDFNATEGNAAIRFILGDRAAMAKAEGFSGLKDSFNELHSREKKRGTLHFWMSDPTRQWKVDHIFVSKQAEIISAEVVRSGEPYLSDHFPVKTKVKFPNIDRASP